MERSIVVFAIKKPHDISQMHQLHADCELIFRRHTKYEFNLTNLEITVKYLEICISFSHKRRIDHENAILIKIIQYVDNWFAVQKRNETNATKRIALHSIHVIIDSGAFHGNSQCTYRQPIIA